MSPRYYSTAGCALVARVWWSPPLCDWQLFSVGGRLITPRTRAIRTVQRLRAQITVSVRFNLCITQLRINITLEHLLCPAWSIRGTNWTAQRSMIWKISKHIEGCLKVLYLLGPWGTELRFRLRFFILEFFLVHVVLKYANLNRMRFGPGYMSFEWSNMAASVLNVWNTLKWGFSWKKSNSQSLKRARSLLSRIRSLQGNTRFRWVEL